MKNTKKASLLPGARRNPRKISDTRLSLLRQQLIEFGDLGGIVFNRTTNELVSGHQRMKEFSRADSSITIERNFSPATRSGTVAEGYIVLNGERFSYREVEWSAEKAAAALLAANNNAGQWDDDILAEVLKEVREEDLALTGFSDDDIADLLADPPKLKELNVRPPPKMAWALIGIPISKFALIQSMLDTLPDETIIKTTVNDG